MGQRGDEGGGSGLAGPRKCGSFESLKMKGWQCQSALVPLYSSSCPLRRPYCRPRRSLPILRYPSAARKHGDRKGCQMDIICYPPTNTLLLLLRRQRHRPLHPLHRRREAVRFRECTLSCYLSSINLALSDFFFDPVKFGNTW